MKVIIDLPTKGEASADAHRLVWAVLKAHTESAELNDNVSSAAVRNCAAGNPGTLSPIASAILSLGQTHGPVTEAREIWRAGPEYVEALISRGKKVPGFGNSFYPEGDPKWFPVREIIRQSFHFEEARLEEMYRQAEFKSETLHPNAAMFTAITAEIIGLLHGHEALLLLLPRLPVWFRIMHQ